MAKASGYSGNYKSTNKGADVTRDWQARCAEWALRIEDDEPFKPVAWLKDCYAQWHERWPNVLEVVTPNPAVSVFITERYLAQIKSSLSKEYSGDYQLLIRPQGVSGRDLYSWAYRCGMKPKDKSDGAYERISQFIHEWRTGNVKAT